MIKRRSEARLFGIRYMFGNGRDVWPVKNSEFRSIQEAI